MTAPTFSNLIQNGSFTAGTSYTTASVTPTALRLVLVTVHAYLNGASVYPPQPTVAGNGITYELIRAQNTDVNGPDHTTMWVFRGMSAAPTAGAITITFPAAVGTCSWVVDQSSADVATTGVNGAGAIVASNGAQSATTVTTISAAFSPAMTAGNAGFAALGVTGGRTLTARAGWTEIADFSTVSTNSIETQYIAGTDTAGSSSWTSATFAGAVVVEVTPVATTPTTTPNAGPDQGPVPSLIPVGLSGAASTGSPTAYQWRIISGGGTLSSTSIVNPTYMPPATVSGGTAAIGLKVGAPTIGTAEDTMTVTYRPHREWGLTATGPIPYLVRIL